MRKLDFDRAFCPGLAPLATERAALWAERVEDVMSRGLVTLEPDDPVVAVVDLVRQRPSIQ